MASHTVPAGSIGKYEFTLAAATQDTVTFDDDVDVVEVLSHDGAAAVYFTVSGGTATVAGQDCWMVPAAAGAITVDVGTAGDTVVKLISAGTPKVSVSKASRVR